MQLLNILEWSASILLKFQELYSLFYASVWCSKWYAGVSLKTQELYALVFASRYLDIFTNYFSLYNTVMKLIFLATAFAIVWYMRSHKVVRQTYDKDQDTFRHYFLVVICFGLALVLHHKFTFLEVKIYPIYLNCTLKISDKERTQ
jgi:ER lumen protein retaining receptor